MILQDYLLLQDMLCWPKYFRECLMRNQPIFDKIFTKFDSVLRGTLITANLIKYKLSRRNIPKITS